MKFTNNNYECMAYGLLILLAIIIICYSFTLKYKVAQNLDFHKQTNMNSNNIEGFSGREGYTPKNVADNGDIFILIENKLKGLVTELGGDKGKKETTYV